ncbi:TB2/DP1, HVA22 family-domain-containing protein [Scenedesmus sp. NREL 46B-D3]|nr:TB2/DP1, HVA22 family-domain-containing protein [Scenedesmus sp. NREL 46B-D3]
MPIAATMSLGYSLLFASFAYLLPGYQTFKAIEKKGSDDVREWACYWTVLATFYCMQPFIDLVLSWLPFYYLFKLGFLLGLWYPSTKWAQGVYARAFRPLVSSYEADIDKFCMDGKTKLTDLMGQHATTIKGQARNISGQASVVLKNIQQKAMDRARVAPRAPAGDAAVGHGLHSE